MTGRPRSPIDKKLQPVPIRLLPETIKQVEQIAETRKWPIGLTIRVMIETAIRANLVPPVALPETRLKETEVQPLS